jgi:hypothetical protein
VKSDEFSSHDISSWLNVAWDKEGMAVSLIGRLFIGPSIYQHQLQDSMQDNSERFTFLYIVALRVYFEELDLGCWGFGALEWTHPLDINQSKFRETGWKKDYRENWSSMHANDFGPLYINRRTRASNCP